MDAYQVVADECGVTRDDVKRVSFSLMYGFGKWTSEEHLLNAIRKQVKVAVQLGVVKLVDKMKVQEK